MIEYPEKASYVDTEWRTSLLQKDCKSTKYFMLDIDTLDKRKLNVIDDILVCCENEWNQDYTRKNLFPASLHDKLIINKNRSPNGWHYITHKFDTREICKLDYVTLFRDGYFTLKQLGDIMKIYSVTYNDGDKMYMKKFKNKKNLISFIKKLPKVLISFRAACKKGEQ